MIGAVADIIGIPAESLTLSGLLGLAVLAVLSGLLVPRRSLTDKQRESDHWRAAWELAEKARGEQAEQIRELAELARTTNAMISALPRRGDDLPSA